MKKATLKKATSLQTRPNLISAAEAAALLGVKPATLYAYVSRNRLARVVGDDGRTSWFNRADIDRMIGSRRRRSTEGAVEVPLVTGITRIADEGVWFRGRSLADLIGKHGFESVADLVLAGGISSGEGWPAPVRVATAEGAESGQSEPSLSPIDRMIRAALVVAARDPYRGSTDAEHATGTARLLVATFADLAPISRRRPIDNRVAARLAARVSPRPPSTDLVDVMDVALTLMVDHDLASSTLAARVAASTRSDVYGCVIAALATLGGPLHGTAALATHRLYERAAATSAEAAVAAAVSGGGRLPGWGHRVYRGVDPRATILLQALRRSGGNTDRLRVVDDVRRVAGGSLSVHPNVDFAMGALTFVHGLPGESSEYIMAVARTAGWVAHVAEEYSERPLRFRPTARYIGR